MRNETRNVTLMPWIVRVTGAAAWSQWKSWSVHYCFEGGTGRDWVVESRRWQNGNLQIRTANDKAGRCQA